MLSVVFFYSSVNSQILTAAYTAFLLVLINFKKGYGRHFWVSYIKLLSRSARPTRGRSQRDYEKICKIFRRMFQSVPVMFAKNNMENCFEICITTKQVHAHFHNLSRTYFCLSDSHNSSVKLFPVNAFGLWS